MTKNFTSITSKKSFLNKFYLAIVLFSAISFSSCKKDTPVETAFTAVSVFNASPTFSTYDVYLNDSKANAAALPFGGGLNYAKVSPGTYNIKFTTSGRPESLLTKSITLLQNTYFSYFLINRPTGLDGLLLTDDLSATSSTNAFVRFINLSPDAPALDLVINAGATITTNKLFKEASTYTSLTAGTFTFDIKDKATGNVLASLPGSVIAAGFHYTIIARGLVTPANSNEHPFSAQLFKQQ
ncbi:DUF4397 domain-containing protein [Pedobacter frigiditerrae]|uniref:DUF4397 domain-containing protein n=1 Tax=Pedobacter frigiditerrae TaxID=2530452 RepID=A0A4R0N2C3_9SPHI|nr:DUF4397 domain-containing protein [Pedobacter frigiditerrae]TCC93900.1 DUF4397 domain-containing protein [Pedobacter frigiditerrae]